MNSFLTSALLLMASSPAMGGGFALTGSVGSEVRTFFEKGAFLDQLDTFQSSLRLEGDIRWQSEEGDWDVVLVPYLRLDGQDKRRTLLDMREAYVRWSGDAWSVRAGLAKVFWGVAESRHLVDIINQLDSVEDIDEEDKLGQPMLEVSFTRDWGQINGYLLPFFRKRIFAGTDGRLRFPLLVDNDSSCFGQECDSDVGVDFALRYSHYFGDWDVGASLFHGTSREARLLFDPEIGRLAPFYDDITQFGVDLQYTTGAWLWKFEGITRDTPFETFFAVVGGLEYTLYGVSASGADLGVLIEYQYDSRSENPVVSALTSGDNDVFLGARLALNNVEDTDFLGGIVVDLNDGSLSGLVEASHRFGENWVAGVEGRFFMNIDTGNLLFGFERDSHINLRITRYF